MTRKEKKTCRDCVHFDLDYKSSGLLVMRCTKFNDCFGEFGICSSVIFKQRDDKKSEIDRFIENQKQADTYFDSQPKTTHYLISMQCQELEETLLAKNADYGDSAFLSPVLCPEMNAGSAILVRMSDKINRIVHLESHPTMLESEPLEDAYRDLAGYCILKLIEMRKGTES